MKYRGYCRGCDDAFDLTVTTSQKYKPTYCPGCGKIKAIIWTEIEEIKMPDTDILTGAPDTTDPDMPDIVEAIVALSAKIYDVLSPEERLMFWQIVRNALNKNL